MWISGLTVDLMRDKSVSQFCGRTKIDQKRCLSERKENPTATGRALHSSLYPKWGSVCVCARAFVYNDRSLAQPTLDFSFPNDHFHCHHLRTQRCFFPLSCSLTRSAWPLVLFNTPSFSKKTGAITHLFSRLECKKCLYWRQASEEQANWLPVSTSRSYGKGSFPEHLVRCLILKESSQNQKHGHHVGAS